MRTSNKILIGFLVIIFLIPALVLMSFNSKIKKGQYTVVRQEVYQGGDFKSGNFKPYKVVKFISPGNRVLKCNLQRSDSLYYSYYTMGTVDSVRVYNIADTVFVQYINAQETEGLDERTQLYVNLKLPVIENLIIDNAEVTLDSMNVTNKNLQAEVYGNGVLNIGRIREERSSPDDAEVHEFPYTVQQLSIKMKEGEVALGGKVNIRLLNLQVDGVSVLAINDGAAIEVMHGSLSEKSSVRANWKYVKRLAALTTE